MIGSLLTACGLAAVAFVATSVDYVVLLVALFADPAYRPRQVVAGQFMGTTALLAVSLASALGATMLSPEVVGVLGLLPIALGLKELYGLRRGEDDEDDNDEAKRPSGRAILAVAGVTIANGGDNLAAYVPLFSTRGWVEVAGMTATFLVLTGALCAAAHALLSHPKLRAPIRKRARVITPLVLIALGVFIVVESRAYTLVL